MQSQGAISDPRSSIHPSLPTREHKASLGKREMSLTMCGWFQLTSEAFYKYSDVAHCALMLNRTRNSCKCKSGLGLNMLFWATCVCGQHWIIANEHSESLSDDYIFPEGAGIVFRAQLTDTSVTSATLPWAQMKSRSTGSPQAFYSTSKVIPAWRTVITLIPVVNPLSRRCQVTWTGWHKDEGIQSCGETLPFTLPFTFVTNIFRRD